MTRSVNTQSADAWSHKLSDQLSSVTGTGPVIRRISASETKNRGDMLWWHCLAAPATSIGVSRTDAELLARMRPPADGKTAHSASDTLLEILNQSWGNGEIAVKGPSDLAPAEYYQAEFPDGVEVCFRVVQTGLSPQGESNLDMLMDIELPITLRFGSTQMLLRDLAALNTGSVIEFDQGVDEPVEVMVNGHVIARGEAVMVKGSYGVRISEISSKRDGLLTSVNAVQDRPEQTGEHAG